MEKFLSKRKVKNVLKDSLNSNLSVTNKDIEFLLFALKNTICVDSVSCGDCINEEHSALQEGPERCSAGQDY